MGREIGVKFLSFGTGFFDQVMWYTRRDQKVVPEVGSQRSSVAASTRHSEAVFQFVILMMSSLGGERQSFRQHCLKTRLLNLYRTGWEHQLTVAHRTANE